MTPFATLTDILTRYPAEATVLAADEVTRERDDARIEAALLDASAEIRVILMARYSRDEITRLDADSAEALRIYATDIALYRVALSFSRSNERIKERYDVAIKRLEAIAAGRAALTFEGGSASSQFGDPVGDLSPNEVLIDASPRVMTRDRLRGW